MALNTVALRETIFQKVRETLDSPIDEKSGSGEVKERFARMIADAISSSLEDWIKTATVTVQPGIAVSTSGGAGATTGVGTGTIS